MRQFPIIDLHQDLLLHVKRPDLFGHHSQTGFDAIQSNGFKLVVVTAFPYPPGEDFSHASLFELIEAQLQEYGVYVQQHPKFKLITKREEVNLVLSQDSYGLLLHVEGLNIFNESSFRLLERWYELGLRSVGIMWNVPNSLGGSVTETTGGGLTKLGQQVIEWLQEHHMLVDLTHMNRVTFGEAIRLLRGPLYVSHGNADAVFPSLRNYTDIQLRQIADSGGVIGAFFAGKYTTTGMATIDHFVAHIEHMHQVMGIDHIALGSDLGGIRSGFIDGLESISKINALWLALSKKGYTDEMMEKIAYKNAQRVLCEVLS